MSLFDDDLVSQEVNPVYGCFSFECNIPLTADESEQQLKAIFCVPTIREEFKDGKSMPSLMIPLCVLYNEEIKIIIDAKTPKYEGTDILKLGEFIHPQKSQDGKAAIVLYINNIRNSNSSLRAVFFHELYHAWFNSGGNYHKEIEEPLAELGALCMEWYCDGGGEDRYPSYLEEVKKKNDPLAPYRLGAVLFEKFKNRRRTMLTLLDNYRIKVAESGNQLQTLKAQLSKEYASRNFDRAVAVLSSFLGVQM